MQKIWDKIAYQLEENKNKPHEAGLLKLDCSKARTRLGWTGIWNTQSTCAKIAEWYKAYYEQGSIITTSQLRLYIQDARQAAMEWAY